MVLKISKTLFLSSLVILLAHCKIALDIPSADAPIELISEPNPPGWGDQPESPTYPGLFKSTHAIQTGGAANLTVRHSCGITNSDHVMCWGSNVSGQLGNGDLNHQTQPVPVLGGEQGGLYLENITSITLGHSHSCAIDTQQSVYCWGKGGTILGVGVDTADSNTPVKVVAGDQTSVSGFLENVVLISAGYDYTCALTVENYVYCWGVNISGRLGINSTTASNIPRRVLKGEQTGAGLYLENIRQVNTGFRNVCAVSNDDELFCWGDKRGVGVPGSGNQTTPAQTLSGQQGLGVYLENVQWVNAGWNESCAVIHDGSVYCWGAGTVDYGHDGAASETPVRILAGEQVDGSSAGFLGNVKTLEGSGSRCVLTHDDELFCWGANISQYPSRVMSTLQGGDSLEDIKHISYILGTVWAVDSTGRHYGWGFNAHDTINDSGNPYYFEPYFLDLQD